LIVRLLLVVSNIFELKAKTMLLQAEKD